MELAQAEILKKKDRKNNLLAHFFPVSLSFINGLFVHQKDTNLDMGKPDIDTQQFAGPHPQKPTIRRSEGSVPNERVAAAPCPPHPTPGSGRTGHGGGAWSSCHRPSHRAGRLRHRPAIAGHRADEK